MFKELLEKVAGSAATVLASKLDKPLTNSTQTLPTNQNTPIVENMEASNAAELGISRGNAAAVTKYAPYMIAGGALIVVIFFALTVSKRR